MRRLGALSAHVAARPALSDVEVLWEPPSRALLLNTGSDKVRCWVEEEGVAVILLNRPDGRNALGEDLSPYLRKAIMLTGKDDNVGCVVLAGAGGAFCGGGNVKSMDAARNQTDREAIPATKEARILDLQQKQRTLTGALYAMEKPVVAAVHGAAAGAGMSIALACDVRLGSEKAMMTTAYAKVGLSGDYGISWLLPRLVGPAKAKELCFLAPRLHADELFKLGLLNRVLPCSGYREAVTAFARELAAGPRVALRALKANIDGAASVDFLPALDDEAERMISVMTDPVGRSDNLEALRAFMEKRKPRFR